MSVGSLVGCLVTNQSPVPSTLSKKHVIQCLDMHRRLKMPTTIEDPLSFLLNLLPQSQTTLLSICFLLVSPLAQLMSDTLLVQSPSSSKVASLSYTLSRKMTLRLATTELTLMSMTHFPFLLYYFSFTFLVLDPKGFFFDPLSFLFDLAWTIKVY
jgi:hypothetical protein